MTDYVKDKFPVGQDLDALVAEHVMGWSGRISVAPALCFKSAKEWAEKHGWMPAFLNDVHPGKGRHHYSGILQRIHWTSDGVKLNYAGPDVYRVPAYSTRIEPAWNVVERLGLALVPQSTDDGFHWLALDLENVRYADAVALYARGDACFSAPTAPHAICVAALLSVGYIDAGAV